MEALERLSGGSQWVLCTLDADYAAATRHGGMPAARSNR